MTKLIVALRNFANAPKNPTFSSHSALMCFVWISEQTANIYLYRIKCLVFSRTLVVLIARYVVNL